MINLELLLKYADPKYQYAVFSKKMDDGTDWPMEFFSLEENAGEAQRVCMALNLVDDTTATVYTFWPIIRRQVGVNGMIETETVIDWEWDK